MRVVVRVPLRGCWRIKNVAVLGHDALLERLEGVGDLVRFPVTQFEVDAVFISLGLGRGRSAVRLDLAREGRDHDGLARVREGVVVPRHARQSL